MLYALRYYYYQIYMTDDIKITANAEFLLLYMKISSSSEGDLQIFIIQ